MYAGVRDRLQCTRLRLVKYHGSLQLLYFTECCNWSFDALLLLERARVCVHERALAIVRVRARFTLVVRSVLIYTYHTLTFICSTLLSSSTRF